MEMKLFVIIKPSGERFEADAIKYCGLQRWAVINERGGKSEIKIQDDWKVAKMEFA